MHPDTDSFGLGSAFPATRSSLLRAASGPDSPARRRAFDEIVGTYWRPVYKYLRLRWKSPSEDAQDTTQAFFTRAFETGFLGRFDPSRARFRTFLRVCLDRFVANERQSAARLKRGGGAVTRSLDFPGAEAELAAASAPTADDPEQLFEREWVRGLFSSAVEDLREECQAAGREQAFLLFVRYDLEDSPEGGRPGYADLAREYAVPVTQVTNLLAWARGRLRGRVLDRLRAVTETDEEFREEARRVLGVDLP